MPRYFFHIRNHNEFVRDLEGVEIPSARAALEEARDAAREILAEKIRKGDVVNGDEFEVHDDLGTRLFSLPLRDVLSFE